jgi:hypothetical protein
MVASFFRWLWVLAALLAACGDGGRGAEVPAPTAAGAPGASAAEVVELARRVDALVVELEMLKAELARVSAARAELVPAGVASAPLSPPEGERSPSWYLAQYAASFADGGSGSEYFRLAVQAYARELLGEIGVLVRDGRAVTALRVSLVSMLADGRFRGDALALDVCLSVLSARGVEPVVSGSIAALRAIGVPETARALEGALWSIESPASRRAAVEVLVTLAGDGANAALARLWSRALDDDERAFLISLAVPNEVAGALALFEQAALASQPVRLAAAQAVGEFRFDEFEPFLARWIERESDAEVLVALGAAQKRRSEKPSWSALQAAGPPDANPASDDPKAWASAQGDMGEQWLELAYDPPRRARGLAIHEVNVPGALTRVLATDTDGRVHELWSGRDPTTTPGVFELWFQPTSYAIRSIRLVLDTNRAPGWSEIDAVELIGPDGRAWASSAHASSSYGGGRGVRRVGDGFVLENFVVR